MLKDDIPVIGINDVIVEERGTPSSLMTIFFHTIVKTLLSKVDGAPQDGKLYGQRDGEWIEIVEAPQDGKLYGIKDGVWTEIII